MAVAELVEKDCAVTTWVTPYLLPGALGVPVPTVLIAPWQLDARINIADRNLSDPMGRDEANEHALVDHESGEDAPAAAGFSRVAGADQWLSVEPAYPLTVYRHDRHGLNVAVLPGEIWSLISLGSSNATWDEAAARAGRVMVATADLPSYWRAVEQGRFPTFQDTFGAGCWAAAAPFDTGPDADLSTWPGGERFGPG